MAFLQSIAYQPILGFPVIGYLGILSYVLLVITGALMAVAKRRKKRLPMKRHHRFAMVTLAAATIHGILALVVYV